MLSKVIPSWAEKKKKKPNMIKLSKISEVRLGKGTDVFRRGVPAGLSDDICMSIISASTTLNLECKSSAQRDWLAEGIDMISK